MALVFKLCRWIDQSKYVWEIRVNSCLSDWLDRSYLWLTGKEVCDCPAVPCLWWSRKPLLWLVDYGLHCFNVESQTWLSWWIVSLVIGSFLQDGYWLLLLLLFSSSSLNIYLLWQCLKTMFFPFICTMFSQSCLLCLEMLYVLYLLLDETTFHSKSSLSNMYFTRFTSKPVNSCVLKPK